MAFNWDLAKSMQMKISIPTRAQASSHVDVRVRSLGSAPAYRISFSKQAAQKINDNQIAVVSDGFRLFIVSAKQYPIPGIPGYSFHSPSKKSGGTRPYFQVQKSTVGDLDKFVGDHDLKYSEDFDGYYITPNSSKEAIA